MRCLKKLLSVIVFFAGWCNKPVGNTNAYSDISISDTTATGILPYNSVASMLPSANRADFFTVSDMTILDSLTEIAVYSNWVGEHGIFPIDTFQTVRPIREILKHYYRQIVFYKNEKNERIAWLNFACRSAETDEWKTDWIIVDDGGDCFFNFKINLSKGKSFDVRINGY